MRSTAARARPTPQGGYGSVELSDPSLYLNRDLSWLAFNARVLALAQRDDEPLLERIKFLAIAANNLDEFFMVRLAALARYLRAGSIATSIDGLSDRQQMFLARAHALSFLADLANCWSTTLRPLLAAEDITIVEPDEY